MSALISLCWFVVGIFWAIAGKDLIEVCACFVVAGVFLGVNELSLMRQEMEEWEEDE